MFRIFLAQQRAAADAAVVATLLRAWLREPPPDEPLREPAGLALERLVAATQVRFPVVADLARGVVFAWFGQPLLRRNRARVYAGSAGTCATWTRTRTRRTAPTRIAEMVRSTEPLVRLLGQRLVRDGAGQHDHAGGADPAILRQQGPDRRPHHRRCRLHVRGRRPRRLARGLRRGALRSARRALRGLAQVAGGEDAVDADVYLAWENQPEDSDAMAAALHDVVSAHPLPARVRRLTTTVAGQRRRGDAPPLHVPPVGRPGCAEERLIRGLHPYIAQRMQLERLSKFDLTRLPSSDEEVYLFQCVARENPSDDRLVAFAQVRDLTELREHDGRLVALPTAEDTIAACLDSIRRAQSRRPSKIAFNTNRIVVYVWPPSESTRAGTGADRRPGAADDRRAPRWRRSCSSAAARPDTGELTKVAVRVSFDPAGCRRADRRRAVGRAGRAARRLPAEGAARGCRNTVYPYELTGLLGDFTEHDLDDDHALAPVDRPKGRNTRGDRRGRRQHADRAAPEGVTRVVLLGDPTKSLGALSEPECRRVIAALDLAERMGVPLEWYALSAGARISMESGTENMDWVAAALKRIVEFTQDGGEINIVVGGHQRRRAAVLERRGHDAHAHQGHPGHDAGLGDGADRQAVAGLLRWRVGRGQLRHRRLRPGDGPERPGAVLGAEPAPPRATC